MRRILYFSIVFLTLSLSSCGRKARQSEASDTLFHYAQHISITRHNGYTEVKLADPWKAGHVLHTYLLVNHSDSTRISGHLPEGTKVYVPLRRAVVFTTAHANLMEMLHGGQAIAGVADPQYMHIEDVQKRLNTHPSEGKGEVVNVGNSMKPDVEKIISIGTDAIFLSPFENSGGYGRLEEINIPIIECADYMETGPLGRAEWMKFYGMLLGREHEADSLFAVVEKNYNSLKAKAMSAKSSLSILPDRKTGSVWYVPGGKSSMGLLYKDAGVRYALGSDTHNGSLPLSFETVLDKMGNADIWIMSYNGVMTRRQLLSEYRGYEVLKPFKTGEIYGCAVDKVPYFEEVSWRPDWLMEDFIQLFHPEMNRNKLRYYNKIK